MIGGEDLVARLLVVPALGAMALIVWMFLRHMDQVYKKYEEFTVKLHEQMKTSADSCHATQQRANTLIEKGIDSNIELRVTMAGLKEVIDRINGGK